MPSPEVLSDLRGLAKTPYTDAMFEGEGFLAWKQGRNMAIADVFLVGLGGVVGQQLRNCQLCIFSFVCQCVCVTCRSCGVPRF